MDVKKFVQYLQFKFIEECLAKGLKRIKCDQCGKDFCLYDEDADVGFCYNCGYKVELNNPKFKPLLTQGLFFVGCNGSMNVLVIPNGNWKELINNIPEDIVNICGCEIEDLDYFILHHVTEDKTTTMDFKGML